MKRMQRQINARIAKKQKRSTNKHWTFHGVELNKITYPLGVLYVLYEEHKSRKYEEMEWSESKAKTMAERYFVKVCDIDDDGSLWYCTDWCANLWGNRSNKFDKTWLRKFGRNMHSYIVDSFTIEGYEKEVTNDYDQWVHFIPVD